MRDSEIRRRRRWGFRFAVIEHRWRWWGYSLQVLGLGTLGAAMCLCLWWLAKIGTAILILAFLAETVSYVAHKVEKNEMDPLRHPKE